MERRLVRMVPLLLAFACAVCRAATDDHTLRRDRAPSAKQRFIAVVGMKTFARGAEEQSVGAGLGEELATRLRTDREHFEVLERLQVNEVLAARGGLQCMLDYGDNPGVEGEVDPEGKPMADAMLAEVQETRDKQQRRLYGADLLLLGSVTCGEKSLVANTRLVSVATGVVVEGVTKETQRSADGLEHDVQALAVDLTVEWCAKFHVQATPEMTRAIDYTRGLYLAWARSQELQLRGAHSECLDVVEEAFGAGPGQDLHGRLLETWDASAERLFEATAEGSPERDRVTQRGLSLLLSLKQRQKQELAATCYYTGRTYERAGSYSEAEEEYRECLRLRPGRLLWDLEVPGGRGVYTPIVANGMAYAVSEDGHLLAVDVETGKVVWDRAAGVAHNVARDTANMAVDGEALYAVLEDGHLQTFDAKTGDPGWRADSVWASGPPVVADGMVYLGCGSGLLGLDAKTGGGWRARLDAWFEPPVVADGLVYAVSGEPGKPSRLQAVNARTGEWEWERAVTVDGTFCTPLVAGDAVYVGCGTYVYAVDANTGPDAKTGRARWAANAGDEVTSLAVAEGVVCARSGERGLGGFDAKTGEALWSFKSDGDVWTELTEPVAAGGLLYVGSGDDHLRALDPRTGDVVWEFDAGYWVTDLAVAEGVVYAGCVDASLRAIDAKTGTPLWDFQAAGWYDVPVVVGEGIAYAGNYDGHLRAFDTTRPPGPDYSERATAGLMNCLCAEGQALQAFRFGARLWRQTPGRGRVAGHAFDGAAARACDDLGRLRPAIRDLLAHLPARPGLLWAAEGWWDTRWAPTVVDGAVYGVWPGEAETSRLRAYDACSGRLLWDVAAEPGARLLEVLADVGYVSTSDRRLRVLDPRTGEWLWETAWDGRDSPITVDGVAYVVSPAPTADGARQLWALDVSTGRPFWGPRDIGGLEPVVGCGVAYAASGGTTGSDRLSAVDGRTGAPLWELTDENGVRVAEVADGVAYLGVGRRLMAVEARTRKPIWTIPGDLRASGTLSGGVWYVVCGPEDGPCRLRALDAKTGGELWGSEVAGRTDPPLLVDGVLYAASSRTRWSARLQAFDAAKGALLWECEYDSSDGYEVVNGVAYVSRYNHLRALGARSGALLWGFEADSAARPVHVIGGVVYAVCDGAHMRALDAKTGALLWDIGAYNASVVDGMLYVGCSDCLLRAFDVATITSGAPPEATWSTDTQLWSYVIWGKAGLAVRKITDGFALSQILRYDTWTSADALAAEIDNLAGLADKEDGLGDWDGPIALSLDPAGLCPPELKPRVRAELTAQGIRPAAQLYLSAARANDDPREALEYAQEALRLAPDWEEAKALVAEYAGG